MRTLFILGLLFSFAACRKAPEIKFQLPATTLYAEYQNEAEADKKYLGQWMELTGVVSRSGRDIGDMPFIAFKGDAAGDVECFFKTRDTIRPEDWPAGKTIKVRGRCLGRTLHVLLDHCEIVG